MISCALVLPEAARHSSKRQEGAVKMKACTDTAIMALVAGDETIRPADANAALALLRGKGLPELVEEDRVLTRAEAAAKLRVSGVTISNWAKSGIIRRVAIPNRRKAVGYSWKSVMEILDGRNVAPATTQGGL